MSHIRNNNISFKIIGNYKYSSKAIGKGSFCKVYKGINIKTNEIVAIKKFDIKQIVDKHDNEKITYLLERFWKEIKIIEKLNHINVVRHIETIMDVKKSNKIFLITEYCNGGDLLSYMRTYKSRTENDIKIIFKQLISGIEYLFSEGVIHRDIKPQNILLNECITNENPNNLINEKYTIKIIDFGFAKEWTDENEMFCTICGTPLYIAPEIIMSKKYGISADMWSIGVLLYELLFDNYPFNTVDNKRPVDMFTLLNIIKKTNINDFLNKKINFSKECKDLVNGILQIKIDKRYTLENVLKHSWWKMDLIAVCVRTDFSTNADSEIKTNIQFTKEIIDQGVSKIDAKIDEKIDTLSEEIYQSKDTDIIIEETKKNEKICGSDIELC
jgi:5'-AMP-activated protein kinase catalytic alpha subunit